MSFLILLLSFFIDIESVDKMKEHIFTQIQDNGMIFLPPYDTYSNYKDNTMDHLVMKDNPRFLLL